jgi:hypothetical protein
LVTLWPDNISASERGIEMSNNDTWSFAVDFEGDFMQDILDSNRQATSSGSSMDIGFYDVSGHDHK